MVNIFTAFAMVFLAEMGDKTQLFLIGLSSKYKIKSILIGVALAVAVLNAAAVAAGYLIGDFIDPTIVKLIAGVAFLAFAYTSLLPEKEEEESAKKGSRAAVLTVFLSFLVAELGDKTQIMTLTLSAQSHSAGGGIKDAVLIFAACSAGLFAADIIGMLIGYFLSKKLPEKVFGTISFVIFTAFGIYTLCEAAYSLSGEKTLFAVIAGGGVTLIFAALCAATLYVQHKKKREEKLPAETDENEKRNTEKR